MLQGVGSGSGSSLKSIGSELPAGQKSLKITKILGSDRITAHLQPYYLDRPKMSSAGPMHSRLKAQ